MNLKKPILIIGAGVVLVGSVIGCGLVPDNNIQLEFDWDNPNNIIECIPAEHPHDVQFKYRDIRIEQINESGSTEYPFINETVTISNINTIRPGFGISYQSFKTNIEDGIKFRVDKDCNVDKSNKQQVNN